MHRTRWQFIIDFAYVAGSCAETFLRSVKNCIILDCRMSTIARRVAVKILSLSKCAHNVKKAGIVVA